MTFPYKLIDLTHTLDSNIPTWNGGCGFYHNLHLDYSDCECEYKFRVMKMCFGTAQAHERYSVTSEDIVAFEASYNSTISQNSCVLIKTGWEKF
ncbi:cyclase family protein [Rickettsia akari]|nr:cyclase family protein [Rickettsia akari]